MRPYVTRHRHPGPRKTSRPGRVQRSAPRTTRTIRTVQYASVPNPDPPTVYQIPIAAVLLHINPSLQRHTVLRHVCRHVTSRRVDVCIPLPSSMPTTLPFLLCLAQALKYFSVPFCAGPIISAHNCTLVRTRSFFLATAQLSNSSPEQCMQTSAINY